MPMIRETLVTTVDMAGAVYIAPLGIIAEGEHWIIAPFRPSRTLDNLRAVPHAVASHVDDVRIFAGCLTGRRDWPTTATEGPVPRLVAAVSHWELAVEGVSEDEQRPRFKMRLARAVSHAPFSGFNRAQAAVIELAILSSRLDRLPREKVARETAYLSIAVEKTAGPREAEAWAWLMRRIFDFYGGAP
jgi:uncharacterized protein